MFSFLNHSYASEWIIAGSNNTSSWTYKQEVWTWNTSTLFNLVNSPVWFTELVYRNKRIYASYNKGGVNYIWYTELGKGTINDEISNISISNVFNSFEVSADWTKILYSKNWKYYIRDITTDIDTLFLNSTYWNLIKITPSWDSVLIKGTDKYLYKKSLLDTNPNNIGTLYFNWMIWNDNQINFSVDWNYLLLLDSNSTIKIRKKLLSDNITTNLGTLLKDTWLMLSWTFGATNSIWCVQEFPNGTAYAYYPWLAPKVKIWKTNNTSIYSDFYSQYPKISADWAYIYSASNSDSFNLYRYNVLTNAAQRVFNDVTTSPFSFKSYIFITPEILTYFFQEDFQWSEVYDKELVKKAQGLENNPNIDELERDNLFYSESIWIFKDRAFKFYKDRNPNENLPADFISNWNQKIYIIKINVSELVKKVTK